MRPGGRAQNPGRGQPQPGPALTAAMAGAVDLAALKARSEAAARAAEAPAPAAGEWVVDVTEATFQSQVLDRSFQVPVLLVVTSERAPAAAEMVSTLETLATEAMGGLVLGKIDFDQNPRIAQALQVQAVPTVFAVIAGQLVPGFEGTLPDDQLREFVAAVQQAAQQAGLNGAVATEAEQSDGQQDGGDVEVPEDPRFDAAESALADGDYATARERFRAILAAEPANDAAALGLRQVDLLSRIDAQGDVSANPDPTDVAAQLAAADVAFVSDDADGALRRLLELLSRTAGDERDSVRQRLIEYFDLLGPDDPRVAPARREMARALF
jgi:putative thioredoxin